MNNPKIRVSSSDPKRATPVIDTSVPHPARRYNYWLGGKDHFQADRESGNAIANVLPGIRIAALENRRFLRRAVTYLVQEAGIRQFLDIGTGIPTANNTHEVAQSIAPESRIVYVDNDPIVLVYAQALLTSSPEGATAYLEADLREPDKILSHLDLLHTLDLSQPVALMLVAVLHFVMDDEEAYAAVRTLLDALPSGSYLAVTHGTTDFMSPHLQMRSGVMTRSGQHGNFCFRTRAEFVRFFDELELLPPGVQPITDWWAEDEPGIRPSRAEVPVYGAVARKP